MVQQIRPGKWIPVVVLALMGSLGAEAQQRPNPANAKPGTAPAPAAATPTPPKPSGPETFKEVITSNAVSDDVLLAVH